MRNYIDIVEGLTTDPGFTKRDMVLNAIFSHIKSQIDPDMSRAEFNSAYREFIKNLRFPMKVYRSLAFGDSFFDVHQHDFATHWDEYNQREKDELTAAIKSIDFNAIGVCWTFDRTSARAGGVLGGGAFNDDGAHVIIEAQITSKQCDLLTTLYQNLTVFQEEKEVRLWGNMPLTITAITPNLDFKLPLRGNTGPEGHYDRKSVVRDLRYAMSGDVKDLLR